MWGNPEIRIVDLDNERQFAEVQEFLRRFELAFDRNVDYTVSLHTGEEMVGTGSFAGKVLRNIAILPQYQGDGYNSIIVSQLIQELSRRGIFHYFVFTKPEKAVLFESMGFTEIVRAEPYAALLETGLGSVESYCRQVNNAAGHLPDGKRAALVVNCNPFTLGHREVIMQAAQENDSVIVFVVSEDRSAFPFSVRLRLVKAGVADLPNVAVVPTGDYCVSQATFPAYFTRAQDAADAQAKLDATLFAARIAPAVGISARYAGEEPYCPVTAKYNQMLSLVLPKLGVEFKVVPRKAAAGDVISASKVRELLKVNAWDDIKRLVPDTTYQFLKSDEATPIIINLTQSNSRH